MRSTFVVLCWVYEGPKREGSHTLLISMNPSTKTKQQTNAERLRKSRHINTSVVFYIPSLPGCNRSCTRVNAVLFLVIFIARENV